MSLDELENNRDTLKTPYQVGDYQVSVNLGIRGEFNNGKCGSIASGHVANCFNDTTITVYRDENRLYTTRTMPLMAGDYTRKEIDDKFASMKTLINNETNDRKTAITNEHKYNTNTYLPINSNKYVHNLNETQLASILYNDTDKAIHGFINGVDKPFSTVIKEQTIDVVNLGWNFTYTLPANGILFMMAHQEIRDFKIDGVKPAWFTELMKCGHESGFVFAGKKGQTITFKSEPTAHPLMYFPMQ